MAPNKTPSTASRFFSFATEPPATAQTKHEPRKINNTVRGSIEASFQDHSCSTAALFQELDESKHPLPITGIEREWIFETKLDVPVLILLEILPQGLQREMHGESLITRSLICIRLVTWIPEAESGTRKQKAGRVRYC